MYEDLTPQFDLLFYLVIHSVYNTLLSSLSLARRRQAV